MMPAEQFVTCPKCKSTTTTYWGKCTKCDTWLPGYEPPPPPPPPEDPVAVNARKISNEIAAEYIEVKEEEEEYTGSEINLILKKNPKAFRALKLNEEQSYSLAVDPRFCLVSARAGSGKTRTIVSKMLYLIDYEGLRPCEVLALSFNTGVREEINKRANKRFRSSKYKYSVRNLDFARTFHSLAYHTESKHRILQNDDKKILIRDLLKLLKRNPLFKHKVYRHFRNESFKIDRLQFKDEASYYQFLRNQTLITLRGETVKSQGEKWIADFLFEHGVKYEYERRFYTTYITAKKLRPNITNKDEIISFLDENSRKDPSGKTKREDTIPDFYLPDYELILEHWGIDERETNQAVKDSFTRTFGTSWNEYKRKMDWKRKFWNSNRSIYINSAGNYSLRSIVNVKRLLETSVVDSSKGREDFEKHLYALFTQNGVQLETVDQEKLEEEVWSRQMPRFVTMMQTFIDKFEQRFPDGDVAKVKASLNTKDLDQRQKDFLDIGLMVVGHYYAVTQRHKIPLLLPNRDRYKEIDCDYNQLMANATKSILRGESDSMICGLKVLLIDEYQDFSQLFHEFISAVLQRNPLLQVFCVGDPWQAINRFMGADVRYFENFSDYFPEGLKLNICKNYRSGKHIVDASNALMKALGFQGEPAVAAASFNGRIYVEDIRNMFVGATDQYDPDGTDREIKKLLSQKQDLIVSQYLKRIIEIITACGEGESVLILSRVGKLMNLYELKEVERKLKDFLSRKYAFDQDRLKKITISTIHSAKGQEADTVIVLEANSGRIPLLHPDHDLYEIFGENAVTALQDESRLFYVAITRPKKTLHILHDDYPSDYLEILKNTGLVESPKRMIVYE